MSSSCVHWEFTPRSCRVVAVIASRRCRVVRSRDERIALMSEGSDTEELGALAAALKRHVERRQRAGLRYLPKVLTPLPRAAASRENSDTMAGTELDMLAETHVAIQAGSLEDLRAAIGDCH